MSDGCVEMQSSYSAVDPLDGYYETVKAQQENDTNIGDIYKEKYVDFEDYNYGRFRRKNKRTLIAEESNSIFQSTHLKRTRFFTYSSAQF